MRRRTRRWAWLVPAVLALACDSAEPEPTELDARTAVGSVEGTDIVLGAVIDDDRLAIYQCGGPDTFDTHSGWFRGAIGDGDDLDAFELVLDDMRLVGTRDSEGLEGELVEGDGSRHPFRLDAIADDAQAGLYVAVEGDLTVGVVVREHGDSLVAQGSSCEGLQPCDQVIILSPLTIDDGRIDVQVDSDGGLLDRQVERTLTDPI